MAEEKTWIEEDLNPPYTEFDETVDDYQKRMKKLFAPFSELEMERALNEMRRRYDRPNL